MTSDELSAYCQREQDHMMRMLRRDVLTPVVVLDSGVRYRDLRAGSPETGAAE